MKTRVCTMCREEKLVADFHKKGTKKDGSIKYQSMCKLCNKEYQKQHYKENKQVYIDKQRNHRHTRKKWLHDYMNDKKCSECGENHPAVLDFHHVNPEDKDGNITQMVHNTISVDTILDEIKKCIILCSNCHRKLHWLERK